MMVELLEIALRSPWAFAGTVTLLLIFWTGFFLLVVGIAHAGGSKSNG